MDVVDRVVEVAFLELERRVHLRRLRQGRLVSCSFDRSPFVDPKNQLRVLDSAHALQCNMRGVGDALVKANRSKS